MVWAGLKRWECLNWYTHQNTRSCNPSEVPNLICNVRTVFNNFSSREKQQNVGEGAEHSQGDQGSSQALGTASRAHGCMEKWQSGRGKGSQSFSEWLYERTLLSPLYKIQSLLCLWRSQACGGLPSETLLLPLGSAGSGYLYDLDTVMSTSERC